MSEYDLSIATATKLIAKKGMTVTWRQLTNGAPADPAKPWLVPEEVTVDYTPKVVFLADTRFNYQGEKFSPGTEVPTGFEIAYMAQQPFVPKIKDVIIRDGVEYVVRNMRTWKPAQDAVLYELEIGV